MASVAAPTPHLSAARKVHLVVAVFFVAIGFALLAPTRLDIAILLKEVMHGIGVTSLSVGGFISTATLLGDGFTETIWGRISDHWSRTWTLILGIAAFSIFSILTAVATTLPMLFLMRILLGVGQAMFIPAYFAFLGGIHAKRRGLILGSLGGLFTVGAALNPILTKDMFQATHRWQTPFIYYGIFGLVIGACIFLVGRGAGRIYETRPFADQPTAEVAPAASSGRSWVFSRSMILLVITMMFWGITQYGFLGIFVTYLREQQHFTLGAAAGVASIAGWFAFFFSFVGGYLSDHIGRRWSLLIFGCVALVLSVPLFILTNNFLWAAVIAAIFQACNGVFYPVGIAYAQDLATARNLGVHTGAVSGIGHLAAGISGFIVGSWAGAFGYASLGWFFGGASLVMVVTVFLTHDGRRPQRELRLEPAAAS